MAVIHNKMLEEQKIAKVAVLTGAAFRMIQIKMRDLQNPTNRRKTELLLRKITKRALWLPSGYRRISDMNIILFPVCKDLHWTLVVIDVNRKRVWYFDSLFQGRLELDIRTWLAMGGIL